MKFKTPESMIVFGVMTLILMPIRMIFVTYISSSWYGSFGVASAVAVIMVLLVRHNKLGKFGEMFQRQMYKINNQKRKYLVYGALSMNLFLTIFFVSAIELANTSLADTKAHVSQIMIENNHGKLTLDSSVKELKQATPAQIIWGLGQSLYLTIFNFPIFASIISVENDASGGYFLHFAIVVMVEMCETLGILIFYKYVFPQKKTELAI